MNRKTAFGTLAKFKVSFLMMFANKVTVEKKELDCDIAVELKEWADKKHYSFKVQIIEIPTYISGHHWTSSEPVGSKKTTRITFKK